MFLGVRYQNICPLRSRLLNLYSSSVPFSSIGDIELSFKNVTFEYIHSKPILSEASFNIRNGSKVTIMGQNGSGKSTIIKLMNGTLQANSGQINIKPNIAIATSSQVIQREYLDLTILEFFSKILQGNSSGINSRIAKVMQTVELVADYDRLIKSFSGGQQAR